MPFPWSEDNEVPKDAATSNDSWHCSFFIVVIPLLLAILVKGLGVV